MGFLRDPYADMELLIAVEAVRDYKNDLLWEIEKEKQKLDDQDAEGHIWWNKFEEFIQNHK